MKKTAALFLMVSLLAGCAGLTPPMKPPSSFMQNFTLQDAREELAKSGLEHRTTNEGATAAAGEPTSRRRQLSIEFALADAALGSFQPKDTIERLASLVERKIRAAGLDIKGRGMSNNNFYFNYGGKGLDGSIEVTAERGQEKSYLVTCVIREKA